MENNATNSWLWPALLTAALAAAGYVAKLLIETVKSLRADKRARRTQLLELYSLIKAGDTAFFVQSENRNRLMNIAETKYASITVGKTGFEETMAAAYDSFTPDEKELHSIIRAITIHTIHTLNTALLEWLKKDNYYKAQRHDDTDMAILAQKLAQLEAHLYLWIAKYAIWIPDNKAHALVYLADEQRHGVKFPKGIDLLIERILHLKKPEDEN